MKYTRYKMNKALSWLYLCSSDEPKTQTQLKALRHGFLPRDLSDWSFDNYDGLWNNRLNLLKQIHNSTRYRDKHVKRIIKYLKFHRYMLGRLGNIRLYSGLITFENCMRENRNDNRIVTPTGHNPYELLKTANTRLKRKLRQNGNAFVVGSGIELTIFKGIREKSTTPYNYHEHLLIAVMNGNLGLRSDRYTKMSKLSKCLSKGQADPVTLSIRPLINRQTNEAVTIDNATSDSDYDTVKAFSYYIYKQGRTLPMAKSWQDVNAFKHLGLAHQHDILHGIINTVPKGMRLRSCLSFRRRAVTVEKMVLKSIVQDENMLLSFLRSYKENSHKKTFLLYLLVSLSSVFSDTYKFVNFRWIANNSPPNRVLSKRKILYKRING